jgi:hypothetical protein
MEAQFTKAAAILEARPNLRPWYFSERFDHFNMFGLTLLVN